MGIEIERKFLVKQVPADLNELQGAIIRQGYIIAYQDGTELRVRQKHDTYYLTIKVGDGLTREEIEIELSPDQFERLWPYTEGHRVNKTRYMLPVGDHTAELDLFEGDLLGLILVEVEFDSVEVSEHFVPPVWFGRDVTEDDRYKNKRLAVFGIPQ
jgi:CYTH domain-containing protein